MFMGLVTAAAPAIQQGIINMIAGDGVGLLALGE